MGDWGKLAFFYDYEKPENKIHASSQVRGLISKSYKYPGIEGMIMHAYNGLHFFLDAKDNDLISFDKSDWKNTSDYHELCMAFDEFLHGYVSSAVYVSTEDVFESELTSEDEITNRLFNCEGMYGWLYITYKGNPVDGYACKYAYELGGELYTLTEAFKLSYGRQYDLDDEDYKEIHSAIDYIESHAIPMTEEEFQDFESIAVDWVLSEKK